MVSDETFAIDLTICNFELCIRSCAKTMSGQEFVNDPIQLPVSVLCDASAQIRLAKLIRKRLTMYNPSRFVSLCLGLSSAVFASPTPAGGLSLPIQNMATTSPIAVNGSLSLPNPPWGPDEFSVTRLSLRGPMDPVACYTGVIELLAFLGLRDFEARLPSAVQSYRSPDILISVMGTGSGSRLPQKYVLWGLARIMNMLALDTFNGGIWGLHVHGAHVGRLVFISEPSPLSISASFTAGLDETVSNQTTEVLQSTVIYSRNDIEWTHEFYGDLMTPTNVFMGTIGSIIQAAELPNQNVANFFGSFPGYRCFHAYVSHANPSRLSKQTLLRTMMNLTSEARQRSDFHEQKTRISDSRGEIASGGYFDPPVPLVDSNISTS